jgi:Subtilisin inhibitor-like
MIRTILALTAAAAVLLSSAAAAAGPARPRTDLAPAYPDRTLARTGLTLARTDLTLAYMAEAGYATAVTLQCNPPGGAHPRPAAACRTLRAVGGRPGRIKPAATMCMMIYAPITAQITGKWRGRKITWSKTYGNSCEMTRVTGVLFRF